MDTNAEISLAASGLEDKLFVLLHVECGLENDNAGEHLKMNSRVKTSLITSVLLVVFT